MAKNKCCGTCGCPRMADEPSPKNPSSEGEEARPKLPIKGGLAEARKALKDMRTKEPSDELVNIIEESSRITNADFQRAQRANRTGRKY